MKLEYRISQNSHEILNKFNWLRLNYTIGNVGTIDDRDITRLLINTHYPYLLNILELINKYGNVIGEIGDNLLKCNDSNNFTRLLAELYLFIYLHQKLGKIVVPIRTKSTTKSPDILIKTEDIDYLFEVYTPIDFYGYQYFHRYLPYVIKYLPVDYGYTIKINEEAIDSSFAYNFPDYKQVDKWFANFQKTLIKWLKTANCGNLFSISGPNNANNITVTLKELSKNIDERCVISGGATRSTDTRLFFESKNVNIIAKSQWGIKIKDKLEKQQAGESKVGVLRILLINFSSADASEMTFLNETKYFKNLKNLIVFLSKDIKPYPPYDIVIPCELGFNCGFASPIMLSKYTQSHIKEILSLISLDQPIIPIPVASKEETDKVIKEMMEYNDANDLVD